MGIREVSPADAATFVLLSEKLDQESTFMLFEPGERRFDVEKQRETFIGNQGSDFVAVFVAVRDNKIVGFAGFTRFRPRRASRTAKIVTGVLRAYHRQGLGFKLLSAVEEWAKERMVARLELTVIEENKAAIGLYQKFGFLSEGVRRNALWVDGKPTNELYMAKILEPQ